MVVALACNENWYHYLTVNIYSLLKYNNKIKKIYLFLETDNINEIPELKLVLDYYKVEYVLINFDKEKEKYIDKIKPNIKTRFSLFCFCRLFLPYYAKEDKILYIDTDALVKRDLSPLSKIDIEGVYLCGVKDTGIEEDYLRQINFKGEYINSGFIYMNLKKMRQDKIMQEFIKLLGKRVYEFPDQDVLNLVCGEKKKLLPSIYNFIEGKSFPVENIDLVKTFHFADRKKTWIEEKKYSEIWYDEEEQFYNFYDEKTKLDIIVTLDNSEVYLDSLLDNLGKQSIINKCNIILIDNDSSDKYERIINEYNDKLNIIYKKLSNKVNNYQAKKYGINLGSAYYITFIDPGDKFNDIDALESLLDNAYSYDISAGLEYNEITNKIEVTEDNLHGKIYKRSFIELHDVDFNDDNYYSEEFFNDMIMLNNGRMIKAAKLVYIDYNNEKISTKDYLVNKNKNLENLFINLNLLMVKFPISNKNVKSWEWLLFQKFKMINYYYQNADDKTKKTITRYINKYKIGKKTFLGLSNEELLEEICVLLYGKTHRKKRDS